MGFRIRESQISFGVEHTRHKIGQWIAFNEIHTWNETKICVKQCVTETLTVSRAQLTFGQNLKKVKTMAKIFNFKMIPWFKQNLPVSHWFNESGDGTSALSAV